MQHYTARVHACDTLFPHKRQRPGKDVHEVRQPVRVRRAVELTDVHYVVLIFQHRRWKHKYMHAHTLFSSTYCWNEPY